MMVWSADPETGEVALRQVVQTFVRETGELTHVIIADEAGNTETITCTPEHPFYVEGRGWIGAVALYRGMKVRFASGAAGIVKDVLCEELQKPVAVYNFEVEEFHTYFASNMKVLVHNRCSKIPSKLNISDSQFGKKYGKHMNDYPGLSKDGHRNLMEDIFRSPDKIIEDVAKGEFYYLKGNDLLRLKISGEFVSLYPGVDSVRVLNSIAEGVVVWAK